MRLVALLVLAAFTRLCQAQGATACDDDIEMALRTVGGRTAIPGDVTASDCRPWTAAPTRTTAAVMAFAKPGSDDGAWTVVVALVDTTRGQVQSSHRTELEADATTLIGPQSLRLDLAPYQLKPGVRALGLRFSSDRGNSMPNSRAGTPLRLYVAEGRRLRPVFCQAMGWQDADQGVIGQDPWDEAATTLSISPRQTHGWQDLRLTDRLSRHTPDGKASKPVASQRVCRFDGDAYRCDPPPGQPGMGCDPAGL